MMSLTLMILIQLNLALNQVKSHRPLISYAE